MVDCCKMIGVSVVGVKGAVDFCVNSVKRRPSVQARREALTLVQALLTQAQNIFFSSDVISLHHKTADKKNVIFLRLLILDARVRGLAFPLPSAGKRCFGGDRPYKILLVNMITVNAIFQN